MSEWSPENDNREERLVDAVTEAQRIAAVEAKERLEAQRERNAYLREVERQDLIARKRQEWYRRQQINNPGNAIVNIACAFVRQGASPAEAAELARETWGHLLGGWYDEVPDELNIDA